MATGAPRAGFDAGDYLNPSSRVMRALRMDQLTFPKLGAPGFILVEGEDLARADAVVRLDKLMS